MASDTPAIVIAAGGAGTRIGGNKPSRLLAGKPLVEHALEWARKHSCLVAVSLGNPDQIAVADVPILIDAKADIGPISALQSAVSFAEKNDRKTVLLIGCDQPFLPDDLVLRLTREIGSHSCAMAYNDGRAHPLAALWHTDRAEVDAYVASGGRSLWQFAESIGCQQVQWRDDGSYGEFTNINDLDALRSAEQRIAKRPD